MKFKYKKYHSKILRPVIPVVLEYKGNSIGYEVLVDSGADMSIFPSYVGEYIGIDIESGEKRQMSGVTGQSEPFYVHKLTIKVGGWPYEIEAGFAKTFARNSYGIVGQEGFFDIFVVKFDLLKEEIELKERK
jgi:hypothetical protein